VTITVSSLAAYAQSGRTRFFRKTEYINGSFYRQTSDTIKGTNEPVNLYFFKRYFYTPYDLPEKFIEEQHKNKTLSVWRDPKGRRDYQQNWKNTYTYDGLGRVVQYTYSGCFICSGLAYRYTVTYNAAGQVDRIFDTGNREDGFRFYYNRKGDIVKLEKYLQDKLETVIELLN
jgi:hypothetical protein